MKIALNSGSCCVPYGMGERNANHHKCTHIDGRHPANCEDSLCLAQTDHQGSCFVAPKFCWDFSIFSFGADQDELA